jgi:hypothetical protein
MQSWRGNRAEMAQLSGVGAEVNGALDTVASSRW